ncbi:uncharacterized protein LOC105697124 isoform X2 [Orussus abietinus]|uniref:uncharacterized protein LOC105697124 isoform X2 n=1 Tax=Orussus abietinus TaxID=222816 RepID=UPI0006257B0B|nr:uncharacterized protein LOC105697124 isoform X2 [Orussus abietinus]
MILFEVSDVEEIRLPFQGKRIGLTNNYDVQLATVLASRSTYPRRTTRCFHYRLPIFLSDLSSNFMKLLKEPINLHWQRKGKKYIEQQQRNLIPVLRTITWPKRHRTEFPRFYLSSAVSTTISRCRVAYHREDDVGRLPRNLRVIRPVLRDLGGSTARKKKYNKRGQITHLEHPSPKMFFSFCISRRQPSHKVNMFSRYSGSRFSADDGR